MFTYSDADAERRCPEGDKASQFQGARSDDRGPFSRDRARVLHSAALRRLADKTQVVGPRTGDTPRTRLTHSLEVAQISRGIGSGLSLDPDLCEMAGLTHDLGHPPYGHNGEVALNNVAQDCGGFEGNAQTLRILTRLEPKVLDDDGNSMGLNLTRAALDAACKYPRVRTQPDGSHARKYSAYDCDADILAWAREGHDTPLPPMEAQLMDASDDIAYSVHDVEDGIVSGRITLKVLWDLVELASLAEKGVQAFGGTVDELLDAADNLRQLPTVSAAADFDHSLRGFVTLKKLTSELVGRYVAAATTATLKQGGPLGRQYGRLIQPKDAANEVRLLKTIAVLYVIDAADHKEHQRWQRDRIYRVHDFLMATQGAALEPMFQQWWNEAATPEDKHRVVIDQIASMTEKRLEDTAKQANELSWPCFF